MVTVYSDERLDLTVFGWEMPVSWVQSINPVFIIIFAGVFAAMWTRLGRRQPSTPVEVRRRHGRDGAGVPAVPAVRGRRAEQRPAAGDRRILLVFTIAELLLSPVGLSLSTKLAPTRVPHPDGRAVLPVGRLGTAGAGSLAGFYNPTNEVPYFSFLGTASIVVGVALLLARKSDLPPDGGGALMIASAETYAERLFAASVSTYETFSTYVGLTLGWFAALADGGPATSAELAARTGTQERYCREFCEFQASLGTLTADAATDHRTRVFTLPPGPAEVLLDEHSLNYLGPLTRMAAAAGRRIDDLLTAYRDGGGVSWDAFGDDARESQAALNRPWFDRLLAPALAGVPEVHDVLGGPGARILDVGCGGGWSTLALARAYPTATCVGVDIDAPSLEAARAAADASGLTDRVRFELAHGETLPESEPYDAAFAFECLHDMPRPVEVLAAIRSAVRPGGVVVIMDEAVADTFEAPGSEIDQCMYGFSLFICLPDGMASAPLGRHRHGDAAAAADRLRVAGRVRRGHGAAHRGLRFLPVLPAVLTRPWLTTPVVPSGHQSRDGVVPARTGP